MVWEALGGTRRGSGGSGSAPGVSGPRRTPGLPRPEKVGSHIIFGPPLEGGHLGAQVGPMLGIFAIIFIRFSKTVFSKFSRPKALPIGVPKPLQIQAFVR